MLHSHHVLDEQHGPLAVIAEEWGDSGKADPIPVSGDVCWDLHIQFSPIHSFKLVHFFTTVFPSCPLISPHYPKLVQFTHFSALLSLPFTADCPSFPGASHLVLVFANFIYSSLQVLSPSPLL